MVLEGKRVMVVGLARTGVETARFLAGKGAEVIVTDLKPKSELLREVEALSDLQVRFFLGGEDTTWLDGVEVLVPSPGVPEENSLLRGARERGIRILSEIELAFDFLSAPLIAVTGTNGKTTTTTLVGEILRASGAKVFVGGNIGFPLIGFVGEEADWGVVEVSSFQLEWVERFRPRIAVLLNLSEDHLDRYPSFAAYREAKEKIFAAQEEGDLAVLNRDDPLAWSAAERVRARLVSFGWGEVGEGVFVREGEIVWRGGSGEESFSLARVKIFGVHNIENLMAAVAVAKLAGASAETIQSVIEDFRGLEHRLEFVREKDGVVFYNDSKGTNVGAVVKSLQSFSRPVILIAGGVDKGGDYRVLEGEVRRRVKKLVLFGAARDKIKRALGHLTEASVVQDLEEAVHEAYRSARSGDVILLSPACSSFDMFQNYAERGRAFKALVQSL